MTRTAIGLGLAAFVLAVPLLASAHGPTARIGLRSVTPPQVAVAVGGAVHFHIEPGMPAGVVVVADDGSFRSPPLGPGEGWHQTFETEGIFGFHLEGRSGTKGQVVVYEE